MSREPIDAERLSDLGRKYAGSVPRYTSYPTAVELKACGDAAPVDAALKGCASENQPLYLYVHLPYCPNLCYFCACNKIQSLGKGENQAYLTWLRRECALTRAAAGRRLEVAQLHFGGGSPSHLKPDEFEELFSLLDESFAFTPNCEKSIEVDPRTFSREKAELVLRHGVKRVSVGIQDFDPYVQRIINRNQSAELSAETVAYLRESGVCSLNFDLIYGLPEQTPAGFEQTVRKVVELKPERIALYGYAHVKWKAAVQNAFDKYHLPTPQERLALFGLALRIFEAAGYEYIGIDHFALPEDELYLAQRAGTLKRNFMGYCCGSFNNTLAIGVSSISDIHGCLYQNSVKLEEYTGALSAGKLPIAKLLERSIEDKIRARIIERLMCDNRLTQEQVLHTAPDPVLARRIFLEGMPKLQGFAADGLVELTDAGITVTRLGRLFVRNIASVYDTYLAAHAGGTKPTFSQAV